MRTSLAIFDLDGTLIHSAGGIRRALNLLLADLGLAPLPLDQVTSMVGDGAMNLIQRAFALHRHTSADLAADLKNFMTHYTAAPIADTHLYAGVVEALQQLQEVGVQLVLCTNKPLQLSVAILEQLGIAKFFAAALGGDSRPYRKPDPRMLQELLDQFGVQPSQAVLVGDSEVDAETAQAAGVPFILVSYGYRRGELAAIRRNAMIDNFTELNEAVRRLG